MAIMKRGYLLQCSHWLVNLSLVVSLCTLLGVISFRPSYAQSDSYQWSEPVNVSNTPDASWFPDLVVDSYNNVHIVWCETVRPEKEPVLDERVYHRMWDGNQWSESIDIVASGPDINRNALGIDRRDNLYLTFRYAVSRGIGTVLLQAPAKQAWTAAAWTRPHRLDVKANAYMTDLAVDSQGVLHVVFDDRGVSETEICYTGCSDIYYRRSADQGRTWSSPFNLSHSPAGVTREQIKVDSNDTIHVTWDDGWDRITEAGEPVSASYTFSTDGGKTWAPITSITHPESTVAQLTAGSDGQGGVMLVWRATSRDELYYQWSTDDGQSWGAPSVIPGVFARPWTIPYDMYDMATDSLGHIHLLVVGRQSWAQDALLGVYHLVWDGDRWSTPEMVFAKPGFRPEYPKIVVHEGNQFHAVWFTREGSYWDQQVNREVWYSSSESSAPHQPVTPLPTFTPIPPTATPNPTPTVTPYPTVSLEGSGLPEGLRTESDEVFRLAIALSPVVLVVLAVGVVRAGRRGKWRR